MITWRPKPKQTRRGHSLLTHAHAHAKIILSNQKLPSNLTAALSQVYPILANRILWIQSDQNCSERIRMVALNPENHGESGKPVNLECSRVSRQSRWRH
jgi:hypothetical protein